MGNFVLAYTGGGMAETPEAQQEAMTQWMNWFGALGGSIVDMGAPFGPSSTVGSDGSVSDGGAAGLTGYSIVTADSLADACDKAKGCPVLSGGGSIEVYEAIPMG
ncbi:MAG: hypothetical protein ACRDZ8_08430 [Acidimicrobiales bacterium]